jgi:gentisate 1,2-dioxygenase
MRDMAESTIAPSKSPFVELDAEPQLPKPDPWPALLVTRTEIDGEIRRLADLDRPQGGRRAAEIVHPSSSGHGIAPGLAITINVVRQGESVVIPRDNANRVEFCIGGDGQAMIGDHRLAMTRFDVWNVPSMTRREYRNSGTTPFVWLSYDNTPLLDRLGIHYADAGEAPRRQLAEQTEIEGRYVRESAPDLAILNEGARLRGYEYLTDIAVVENKALLWPWTETSRHLTSIEGDGKRMIMLLYNPATERRNGTTHSFFATITTAPPGADRPVPARGHKHSSFACNYHFLGGGNSIVDGQHFEWQAGDLMLSAPSWSEHAHGASKEGFAVLTIQDHPFQIGIESLIWQEKMDGPVLTLGSEPGQTGYVGPRLAGD